MDFRCDFEAERVAFDFGAFMRNCNYRPVMFLLWWKNPGYF